MSSRIVKRDTLALALGLLLGFAATTAQAQCSADPNWLPKTAAPRDDNPNSPDVDCPFYQAAWQHFLLATQPDASGSPALFSYKNIQDLFGPATISTFLFPQRKSGLISLAPTVAPRPNDNTLTPQQATVVGSDVFQAGLRGLLIDQAGHPIFYGIHVNKNFDDFLTANKLKTKAALLAAPATLSFPRSVVELKSAWQIVDDANPPKTYIIAKATVPALKIQDHKLVADRSKSRNVTVALLALHVVFVLDGHPEFVWSTFEHVDPKSGIPDLAPPGAANPTGSPGSNAVNPNSFSLYKANTPYDNANTAIVTDQATDPPFDEATQTFKTSAGVVQTSIYRMFPGSKSNTPEVDDEVKALNDSMTKLFASSSPNDKRGNYRLVGGIWLKNPLGPQGTFKVNVPFNDPDGTTTDDHNSVLQGEDRLSSMAMESFTQDQFPHCFMCHNTQAVTDDVTGDQIIAPKLLNVSHVLSKFLASQGVGQPPPAQKSSPNK
jgi:hypothetical protein